MAQDPVGKSIFKDKTKYDSLDLGDAKLDRDTMLGIFDETFDVSAVEVSSVADDAAYDVVDRLSQWFKALHTASTDSNNQERWDRAVCRTAALAASAQLGVAKDLASVEQFLRRHTASGEGYTWTAHHYAEEFENIPELEELTNTPFMVQIVTNILPHLSGSAPLESELKSGFVIMLGEALAEVVWAMLREANDGVPGDGEGAGGKVSIISQLHGLQRALDAASMSKEKVEWSRLLRKLAKEVVARVEVMVEKNPAEWQKAGVLPQGCEVGHWPRTKGDGGGGASVVAQTFVDTCFKQVVLAPWRIKIEGAIERALFRTLRRQPTRRVDIYNQVKPLGIKVGLDRTTPTSTTTNPQPLHPATRFQFVDLRQQPPPTHNLSIPLPAFSSLTSGSIARLRRAWVSAGRPSCPSSSDSRWDWLVVFRVCESVVSLAQIRVYE